MNCTPDQCSSGKLNRVAAVRSRGIRASDVAARRPGSVFEFADQPFDKNGDPFTAVIRCTCGGAADNKTISKWARALRYAAIRKPPEMRLKAFMKGAGGVNACADRRAKYFGRGGR
jgi:hypothetical protein